MRYITYRGGFEMKQFMKEFKAFISRGNVMDMAVGIIIGGAFTGIVNSLVNDIINPLLGVMGGKDFSQYSIPLSGDVTLNYGAFISAIINFLIMALVIFSLIKFLNKISAMTSKKEEEKPAAPTTKVCPFCKSEISIDATKCAHCTSTLE